MIFTPCKVTVMVSNTCLRTFTLPCRFDLFTLLWVTNTTPQSATAADAPNSTKRSGHTMPLPNEEPHERPLNLMLCYQLSGTRPRQHS